MRHKRLEVPRGEREARERVPCEAPRVGAHSSAERGATRPPCFDESRVARATRADG